MIQVKPKSQLISPFRAAAEGVNQEVLPKVPGYLDVDLAQLKATLVSVPDAASVPIQVNIQYVVEYYAR